MKTPVLLAIFLAAAGSVQAQSVLEIPTVPKPGYLQSYLDPVFKNRVTRITGDPGTPVETVGGAWPDVSRHGYSKRAAWNADMSLLYLDRLQGAPWAVVLDGRTYQPLFKVNVEMTECRWHPTDPAQMVYVHENRLMSWKAREGTAETLAEFPGYADLHIGPWEGNLSQDGKRIALFGKKGKRQVAFAYDIPSRKPFPDVDLKDVEVDWVSVSASGKYLVVNGKFSGEGDQTQVYDLNGQPVSELWSEYGRPSHYDLTVDADGEDIAAGVSKSKPDQGRVIKRRLRDGKVTVLTSGGWASHTSTRNVAEPGWAYVTYQERSKDWPPFHDEVVAVKLDGSLTVRRLAHLHTHKTDYETEAHAVPSPDGSRVLWASDWEAESGRPIGSYVVEIAP